MTSQLTFYLSQILGKKVLNDLGISFGKIKDLLVALESNNPEEPVRPIVVVAKLKTPTKTIYIDFTKINIIRSWGQLHITCNNFQEVSIQETESFLALNENVLDKQLVDINGRKLVRVNDIRFALVSSGIYTVAVDIGLEGLLRRIGIAAPFKRLFNFIHVSLPSKYILWDDVEAIDYSNSSIKLSKTFSKLQQLHPSDLADIIEELGKTERTTVFASLDEERAADVMEELEPHAQIHLIENLPIEKMADVLEKMPADEVADILDELEEDKAEMLLKEMDSESSEEVRELLEYPGNTVGSIMSTDFLSFTETMTVEETLKELRTHKPESDVVYSLCIIDKNERLIATVSLRDLVVSEPDIKLKHIMKKEPIYVNDYDKIDSLAEIISKYNLLAIPVTDEEMKLEGMVVIDDIVEDLIDERKTI